MAFPNLIEKINSLKTDVEGKAPKNHATTGSSYGLGNGSRFGHVKLSDSADSSNGVASGIAVTPKALDTAMPKSGGTFSGNVSFSQTNAYINKADASGSINLVAAPTASYGGRLILHGQAEDSTNAGAFDLRAQSSGSSVILRGYPDGRLEWGGSSFKASNIIVTSGVQYTPVHTVISAVVDSGNIDVIAGPNWSDGARAILYGQNYVMTSSGVVTNSTTKGAFRLVAQVSSGANVSKCELWGRPDGTLTWGGQNVITESNGYITLSSASKDYMIRKADGSGLLAVAGGYSVSQCARAVFYGADNSSHQGEFRIEANSGATSTHLIGTPDGTLTWGGKSFVYTAGEQIIGGVKSFTAKVNLPKVGLTEAHSVISAASDSAMIDVIAGPNWSDGARLRLYGQNNEDTSNKGAFHITAQVSSGANIANASLVGSPDGRLTWNGAAVIHAGINTASTVSFDATNAVIAKTSTNGYMAVAAAPTASEGARVVLYGKDNTDIPGAFRITARTGSSTYASLEGRPDGTLTWGGCHIFHDPNVTAAQTPVSSVVTSNSTDPMERQLFIGATNRSGALVNYEGGKKWTVSGCRPYVPLFILYHTVGNTSGGTSCKIRALSIGGSTMRCLGGEGRGENFLLGTNGGAQSMIVIPLQATVDFYVEDIADDDILYAYQA